MKITKIFYFAAISASLFLSSCSMNKETADSSYLQTSKLQPMQQLSNLKYNPKELAISAPTNSAPQSGTADDAFPIKGNLSNIQVPVRNNHTKTSTSKNLIKIASNSLVKTIAINKAAASMARLMEKHNPAASINRAGHATDMNYLWMWIIFLLASIVFYILAGVFTLSFSLALAAVFYILGVLASIAALVFFILWIVQLIKG
jgi:hypothetical protein